MAPYLYQVAFQPLADASVLVLLIAAVGVHLALMGIGLVLFGPEGFRATGFSDAVLSVGPLAIQGQAAWVVLATVAIMAALYGFFGHTLFGKALHATAVNRLGARLVGISAGLSGRVAFTLAGLIGAFSGVLIAPLTTVYYDSGFLVGLKGFVAAIVGGLVSYPVAALAALLVGVVESFSTFWASRLQGGDRVHRHPPGAAGPLAAQPGVGGRGMSRLAAPALLLAWLCVPLLPFVPPFWLTLADYAGIAAVVATGIVVLTGMGGITSFGQATFMGFGAYATALLTTQAGWSPWLSLPVAMLASGLMSLVIGAVTLRLSGHYLALGTIAWSVAFFYVFGNLDVLGRNDGISAIPPLRVAGHALLDSRAYFPVVWIAVGLVLLLTRNLLDSRVGRALRALRGGAAAASAFGVGLAGIRMLAFAYAAVLAGLAGWLYAHMQRSVSPTPFGINAGIEYLLMAVVGGLGVLPGAVLGAVLVTVVNDRLQDVLPRLLGSQGNYETIVFGVLLVLLLQVAPGGLWPLLAGRVRRATLPAAAQRPSLAHGGRPLPRRALPPAGTPVLEAAGLRRTFGGLVAVADLSFALHAGEIVGLIGPNGAGKSTTFDLLTGVRPPTAGTVRFLGQPMAGLRGPAVARLGIARSFQHVKLAPTMSLLENVALGAHLRGRAGALRALLRLDRAEEARCSPRRSASSTASASARSRHSRRAAWRSASSAWRRSRARCAWTRCCCCWTSRRPGCAMPRRPSSPPCCARCAPRA